MSWIFFWKFVLITTFVSYSCLVVIVFVKGLKNIKEMFEDLEAQD